MVVAVAMFVFGTLSTAEALAAGKVVFDFANGQSSLVTTTTANSLKFQDLPPECASPKRGSEFFLGWHVVSNAGREYDIRRNSSMAWLYGNESTFTAVYDPVKDIEPNTL